MGVVNHVGGFAPCVHCRKSCTYDKARSRWYIFLIELSLFEFKRGQLYLHVVSFSFSDPIGWRASVNRFIMTENKDVNRVLQLNLYVPTVAVMRCESGRPLIGDNLMKSFSSSSLST